MLKMTINSIFSKFLYKVQHVERGAGEMFQWLKVRTTFIEDQSWFPALTTGNSQPSIISASGDLISSPRLHGCCNHVHKPLRQSGVGGR